MAFLPPGPNPAAAAPDRGVAAAPPSPANAPDGAARLPPAATVAVIGAGTMGAGIAQIAALAGHRVQLHDARFGAADAAKAGLAATFDKLVARGKLARDPADAALARIVTVGTLADACVAGLVIEAIVEDLAAKRALFAQLEPLVDAGAILATNTSSLSITALAQGMRRPGRVVGMHFFNPVPLMPLVEVVSGLATDPAVAATVAATAGAWGKTPVHAASTPGFIVNRCARPFYAEALRLLAERAADPATLDAVLREAGGFRMGPFELMDLIGHDVNFAVTRSVWEAYLPRSALHAVGAAGRAGRGRLPRPQERPRLLRLRGRRRGARAGDRDDRAATVAARSSTATWRRRHRWPTGSPPPAWRSSAPAPIRAFPAARSPSAKRGWCRPTAARRRRSRWPPGRRTSSPSISRSTTPRRRGWRSRAPTPAPTRRTPPRSGRCRPPGSP